MIRYKVADHAPGGSAGVKAFAQFRLASGEKCFYACRGSKDPNELLVWCEWDTTARMKKFAESRELRQAMKAAGVIGKPEVSFYSKMEAVNAN